MTVLEALKKAGQVRADKLANTLGITQRTLAAKLYPHLTAGDVMSCRILDGNGTLIAVEYRMGGTFPISKPGPKIGSRAVV